MVVFINDKFVEQEQAVLHISDLALQRGYAIFDFLRFKAFTPLFFEDHLDRFYHSAAKLYLPVSHSREDIRQIVKALMEKNQQQEGGVKLLLTGGYSEDGYRITSPNLVIHQVTLQMPDPGAFEKGIHIMTYPYRREFPEVKTTGYLMGVWLQPLLKQRGADDVLYHADGKIAECPRANIFIVNKEKIIITPGKDILAGITRKNVLKLAATDYRVEERDISPGELLTASEVFITSSTKRVMPVTRVDGEIIGDGKPGTITTSIHQKLMQYEAEAAMHKILG